jgi:aminoglycoside phosphotransferase (APT) family kinase protein
VQNAAVTVDDPGIKAVLEHLGVGAGDPLGHGGEAWVYALDDERVVRVVRVLHPGGTVDSVTRRKQLVDELARAPLAFALPDMLEVGEVDGRVFAIERRLRGRSLLDELRTADGPARQTLIEAHLDAAAALGDLHLEPRQGFGELVTDDAITTSTWRDYLEKRVAANLAASLPEFAAIDPIELAAPLPDTTDASFVHLDAFTGNMLTDGTRITAVLDIGWSAIAGDRRLDPVSAAVYLASPAITPVVRAGDIEVAMGWLRNARLDEYFEPMRRWLAGYWSFAFDDPNVLGFCRSVLLE